MGLIKWRRFNIVLNWIKSKLPWGQSWDQLGAPNVDFRRCQNINTWPAATVLCEQGLVEVCKSLPEHPVPQTKKIKK